MPYVNNYQVFLVFNQKLYYKFIMYMFILALAHVEHVSGCCINRLFGESIEPVSIPYLGKLSLSISTAKYPGIVIIGEDPFGNPFRFTVVVKSFLPFV
jgi:hypothetical protein